MIYIEIPYSSENKRIDKEYVKNELRILTISEEEKYEVLEAIYNVRPRGVTFDNRDADKVSWLQRTLERLGIGYRRVAGPAY